MTTLANARRIILQGTGRGGVATTTGAGSTSTLVCTDFKSTLLSSDSLDRAWVHVPSATSPKQRRVGAGGLATGSGTITVDDVFGSSIGSATAFEWSPLAPLISSPATGSGPSLEDNLYEALRHLLFADEISVAITTSAEISLSTWVNWLDRPDRLVAVLEPSPLSGWAAIDASWRFEDGAPLLTLDADTPILRLKTPFLSATGNLTLQVRRPADTWLKLSGTWQEVAPGVGMAADTDECKPDLRHIREAGLVFFYLGKAQNTNGALRAEYQQRYEQQLAIARQLPFWDRSRDALLPGPGQESKQEQAA